jgi:uncharacterized protein (TIGR02246 family)
MAASVGLGQVWKYPQRTISSSKWKTFLRALKEVVMRSHWLLMVTLAAAALVTAKPAPEVDADSEEETAIRAVLTNYVTADSKHDIDGILVLFASDARVDSIVARGKLSKEQYAGAMRQAQARGYLGANHAAKVRSVTLLCPDRGLLEFDYELDSPGGRGHRNYTLKWTLAKREGRWLIVETEYLKK